MKQKDNYLTLLSFYFFDEPKYHCYFQPFSSPELKAPLSFYVRLLFVIRLSVSLYLKKKLSCSPEPLGQFQPNLK